MPPDSSTEASRLEGVRRAIAVIGCLFVVIALLGCSGHTEPATNVTSTSATLHAPVSFSSTSEYGVTWFEYSSDGGQTWAQTQHVPWGDPRLRCRTGAAEDRGGNFTQMVSGLTPGAHYIYRLAGTWCGSNPIYLDSNGTVNGTIYSGFDTPPLIARDIASEAGIGRTVNTAGENCVFDYDRDGVLDLFVSNHADAPWQLFRGAPDGKFVETNVGTFPLRDRHGCATGDFNADGRPDIYASIGACVGTCLAPKELWIQTGDGTFVDAAAEFGVADPRGRGREPIALNANNDGWADLYTGQAVGVNYPSPNRLWVNQGGAGFVNPPDLPTEEIGNQCDTAGDFDRDGFDELIVCDDAVFRVYDNKGGIWSDATAAVGLPTWARPDAELADLNGDGWLDLVTVTGLWLEVRLNRSARFPTAGYALKIKDGRDLAIGDADGDGDQDIYVLQGSNATVPDLLLMNQGSGMSYTNFPGLPQVASGEGDRVEAIPGWKGTRRAAFLVNNGFEGNPGPRQLIELVDGAL
jgi:FG-GAP-like repeat